MGESGLSIHAWLRLLVFYPVIIVFGLGWLLLFYARWKVTRNPGDRWAGFAGLGVCIFAGFGLSALWIGRQTELGSSILSALLNVGLATLAAVLVAGIIAAYKRRNGKGKPDE